MPPVTFSRVLSLLVLVAVVVLLLTGRIELLVGLLIGGLSLAQLVP